jgi:hypothetical protein
MEVLVFINVLFTVCCDGNNDAGLSFDDGDCACGWFTMLVVKKIVFIVRW